MNYYLRRNYPYSFFKLQRTFSYSGEIGDPYKTLGIKNTASKEEVKKAFRKMAKMYHPDKDIANEEIFRTIIQAYHILSDDSRRSEYDKKLQKTGQYPLNS